MKRPLSSQQGMSMRLPGRLVMAMAWGLLGALAVAALVVSIHLAIPPVEAATVPATLALLAYLAIRDRKGAALAGSVAALPVLYWLAKRQVWAGEWGFLLPLLLLIVFATPPWVLRGFSALLPERVSGRTRKTDGDSSGPVDPGADAFS